jgi:hypothetical protein
VPFDAVHLRIPEKVSVGAPSVFGHFSPFHAAAIVMRSASNITAREVRRSGSVPFYGTVEVTVVRPQHLLSLPSKNSLVNQ